MIVATPASAATSCRSHRLGSTTYMKCDDGKPSTPPVLSPRVGSGGRSQGSDIKQSPAKRPLSTHFTLSCPHTFLIGLHLGYRMRAINASPLKAAKAALP